MKIHILRCGTIRPRTGRSPLAARRTLPVWCYLIEHPAQGPVLVDTGLGAQPVSPFLERYYRPEPGEPITEKLSRMGIAPNELSAVILSDLDIDHTGGLHELRQAKRFLVSEEEYYWTARSAFSRFQPRALWENDVRFEAYYLRAAAWAPAWHALDLFGDGTVVSVLTKGHTFGCCTIMLQWHGKTLLLAGNAVRSGRTLENDRVYHPAEQEKTVRWLRAAAADPGCIGVLATHDPEEHERTIEISERGVLHDDP